MAAFEVITEGSAHCTIQPHMLLREISTPYRSDRGQLKFRRIDSPVLLPVGGRCLMRMLPVNNGVAHEEATERGDTKRVSRSNQEAISGSNAGRQDSHSERVRRSDGVSPKALRSDSRAKCRASTAEEAFSSLRLATSVTEAIRMEKYLTPISAAMARSDQRSIMSSAINLVGTP
jgi:hypothetical protein